ncbi:MAG: carboxymuconolactone decarboxylase family protein [candidate division NC10 bacterium]|jgi:alkylhydroperoxidase/carboxymuconolactone decarboxylase family protein YurZ
MPIKEFAGMYYVENALEEKTRQLVALAAMIAAGCFT